jgi:hypothetical protein
MSASQLPLRYDLEVASDGRIQVKSPLPPGSHITVYVVEQTEAESADVLAAALSSTGFRDNPEDDEDWSHA